jgi:hypothetical protein
MKPEGEDARMVPRAERERSARLVAKASELGQSPEMLVDIAGGELGVILRAIDQTADRRAMNTLAEALRLVFDRGGNGDDNAFVFSALLTNWIGPTFWAKGVRMRTLPRVGEFVRDQSADWVVESLEHQTDVDNYDYDVWINVAPRREVDDAQAHMLANGWNDHTRWLQTAPLPDPDQ